jgi:transposase
VLARRSKNVNQSRRQLSLAAVRDGMDRRAAAKIGGMDRQTLRDWVHRFNATGPEGLIDNWTEGPQAAPVSRAVDRVNRRGRAGS